MLMFGFVVALSPWKAPGFDPANVERHKMQQCFEDDERHGREAAETAVAPSRAPATDAVRPAQIRRGPPPAAFIAAGATLLAAGTAMRVPSPMFLELQPPGDPSGRTITAGYTSYTHTPRQVALGAVGTVLQAIGAGALQHGLQQYRSR